MSEDREQPKRKWCFNRNTVMLLIALGVIGLYLIVEHGAHLIAAAPWLILLLCPLMHLFHGHGGHGGHGHKED